MKKKQVVRRKINKQTKINKNDEIGHVQKNKQIKETFRRTEIFNEETNLQKHYNNSDNNTYELKTSKNSFAFFSDWNIYKKRITLFYLFRFFYHTTYNCGIFHFLCISISLIFFCFKHFSETQNFLLSSDCFSSLCSVLLNHLSLLLFRCYTCCHDNKPFYFS